MGFLSWIGKFVLDFILEKIVGAVTRAFKRWTRNSEIDAGSKASVDPLKKAKTPEEVDDASRDALDGF